jgi:hypothetical protein
MNDKFRNLLKINYLAVIFQTKKPEFSQLRKFRFFLFEKTQNTEGPLFLMLHHKLLHRLPLFSLHRKEI